MASLDSCDKYWDLLSAYADSLTTPTESAAVEEHVAACEDCARDLHFMRETAVMLARTPIVAPPPGLQQRILAATVYRPTWRQRVGAAVAGFAPRPSIRGLARTGAFATLVLAGYVAYTRQPEIPLSVQPTNVDVQQPKPRPTIATNGNSVHPQARRVANLPANVRPGRAPSVDVAGPADNLAAIEDDTPAVHNAPVIRPASSHPASHASGAKTRLAAAPPYRRPAQSPRPTIADAIAPNLQPERSAQPDDMQVSTADMQTPMPMNTKVARSDMDPKSPMGAAGMDIGSAAAPSAKSRFALAVQPEISTSGAIVSLAELRRQLRMQNGSVEVIHPELHLHGRRDMLDVMKSTF